MNKFIVEVKNIAERYPKLREELDGRGVWTLMEQPMWKMGSIENLNSIIHMVP